ncbi:MAG: TIGR03084 family metal-binding protein [Acidimicrobiales bacterium]
MSELDDVRADLVAEQRSLDELVGDLTNEQWLQATPSEGWNVADQIGHLTYFDVAAATAITRPEDFRASLHALIEGASSLGLDEYTLGAFRQLDVHARLSAWREGRADLERAALTLGDEDRVPWYGPSMSAKSFLTARLMEVWAHATDVADALSVRRTATDRLRHIAQLGFITRSWSYSVRGETPPVGEVRVQLVSPSGAPWTRGAPDAQDTITGTMEDFCLVVTQRRHLDDTTLSTGELGRHWLLRAQAFAGGPTLGPTSRGAR